MESIWFDRDFYIILPETWPKLVLETSEYKVKQPHRFPVQQNFQSTIAPDQFSISQFRHTIWLCKMENADWTFENTDPAHKHTVTTLYTTRPPQNLYHLPHANIHFTILHYLTFMAWLNFSDNHCMVMFTTSSESTVTGPCSIYLSVTKKRSLSKYM